MLKMSQTALIFSIVSLTYVGTALAENRAIVFGTTCAEYESTLDDVASFGGEAVKEFNALSANGWKVIALYGGKSAWCQPGRDAGCVPSKTGRADQILSKSAIPKNEVKIASRANLMGALSAAVDGPNALRAGDQLLMSVITHGNQTIFCAADGVVTHQSLLPYFTQLKNRGVKVAFDANHCFSGGAVKILSPAACVVSVSSTTTTGLSSSTNLEALLNANAHATFEDLFLARLVSPNALFNFRHPEISGFKPGNTANDQVSDRMYFGDKNLLTNDTLTNMCAKNGGMGKECNLIRARLPAYQTLSSSLDYSLASESTFRDLFQRYQLSYTADLGDVDIGPLFQGDFYANLNQKWDEYLSLMNASARANTAYAALDAQIKTATFQPFQFLLNGLDAYPGLKEVIDVEQRKWQVFKLTPDGHLVDAVAFSQFLMSASSDQNWLLQNIANTYFIKQNQQEETSLSQEDLQALRENLHKRVST